MSWERDHPLLRDVLFDNVVYSGFTGYLLPAAATPLAFGRDGPIIAQVRSRGADFLAEVQMYDAFVTGEPLLLHFELMAHAQPGGTELFGLASPLAKDAPVWAELHAIGKRWRAGEGRVAHLRNPRVLCFRTLEQGVQNERNVATPRRARSTPLVSSGIFGSPRNRTSPGHRPLV